MRPNECGNCDFYYEEDCVIEGCAIERELEVDNDYYIDTRGVFW